VSETGLQTVKPGGGAGRRRLVVVGAGGGIGSAIVSRLITDGARIMALDLPTRQGTVNRKVEGFSPCDLANEDSVFAAVGAAAELLGGIDVVVNAGGVSRGRVPAHELTVVDWDEVMGVNARGSFLLAKFSFPFLVDGHSPSLVLIASQLGLVAVPEAAAYCASKGAVIQLARSLAIDWAPYEIAVNAICPGPTATPMVDERFFQSDNAGQARMTLLERTLTKRFVQPDEIAETVALLAKPGLRSLTGSVLVVDAGYTAL